jgi:hypothetical protein
MKITEIFQNRKKIKPVADLAPHIVPVKGEDGKVSPRSETLAALADAAAQAKKPTRKPVLPTGKKPPTY